MFQMPFGFVVLPEGLLVFLLFLRLSDFFCFFFIFFGRLKVPITPQIFFCLVESLCHAEQNGENIFVFGENWNFL